MKKNLILIADYCTDSLAVAEVELAMKRNTKAPFSFTSVASRPFNTIHTGFLLDQLDRGLNPTEAKQTVFFLNTDPRTHTKEEMPKGDGSPLFLLTLKSGAVVISPNAGYCLSFIKNRTIKCEELTLDISGTQFRSRDIFPLAVAKALEGDVPTKWRRNESLESIPDLQKGHYVLHVDNYGNVKTSITRKELTELGFEFGDKVIITIEKNKVLVSVLPSIFAGKPGSLVFAPGSSGDPTDPYCELSLRFNGEVKKSAGSSVNWPEPGAKLQIVSA
ncbi:MAG: hypothetical protein UX60_C0032G0015 [Berkelbacteria bacterium GW2011_GWA2_46_7]|uniref:Uncharacterized protein n=1 Tax=Berkelbacteria bacterium GW2011_GWA2_46_7 TaxID=1618335 RepID=A0A0G1TCT0_9BACT|nr:MAG: hypothetical protein UX60_C0032G0015 [Berkelbacteria bacterium GW2011_GWA2_46_7]